MSPQIVAVDKITLTLPGRYCRRAPIFVESALFWPPCLCSSLDLDGFGNRIGQGIHDVLCVNEIVIASVVQSPSFSPDPSEREETRRGLCMTPSTAGHRGRERVDSQGFVAACICVEGSKNNQFTHTRLNSSFVLDIKTSSLFGGGIGAEVQSRLAVGVGTRDDKSMFLLVRDLVRRGRSVLDIRAIFGREEALMLNGSSTQARDHRINTCVVTLEGRHLRMLLRHQTRFGRIWFELSLAT
ncbi:hypothetical protein KCU88_g16, partial [Aureobasidium melanogenum]